MEQLTLDQYAARIVDPPVSIPDPLPNNKDKEDLRAKTEKWLAKNPNIYELYRKFAWELLKKGKSFNISLITERIRWECYFEYNTEFKISNDYRAYIARKLCQDIPQLKDVFKFKKTRY